MKSADLAFAEYLDWCCGRYAKSPKYRSKLQAELPAPPDVDSTHTAHHRRRSA